MRRVLCFLGCLIQLLKAQKECPIVCPDGRSLCDYNGTTAVTNGGRTCQKWTDQSPHSHYPGLLYGNQTLEDAENYCRSFEHEGKNYGNEPWCLTTDPEHRRQGCGETICGGSQCGGTISKSVGTLTLNDSDGRFGIPVPNGIDCLWNLTAPRDMLMEIYILQFQVDLGNHDHCSIASVEVYEGNGSHSTIGYFCSHNGTGAYVRSNTNNLYVHFEHLSLFRYPVLFIANYSYSHDLLTSTDVPITNGLSSLSRWISLIVTLLFGSSYVI